MEYKYTTQKQGIDKFLIKKYFDFVITEGSSLLEQGRYLHVLVSKLKDLGVEISESLQVGAIISKLHPIWNDCQKKLLHTTELFSVDQILKHHHIEEDVRIL